LVIVFALVADGRRQLGFKLSQHHISRNAAALAIGRINGGHAAPHKLSLRFAFGDRSANCAFEELRQGLTMRQYAFKLKPEIRLNVNDGECGCFHE
jgi:hypothetical protein